MSIEILEAKAELKDLVDTFSNLADVKDAAAQGELFLPDGALEFQMGMDGEINKIEGREALGLSDADAALIALRKDSGEVHWVWGLTGSGPRGGGRGGRKGGVW